MTPYIPHHRRIPLDRGARINGVGELTYKLYAECLRALPSAPRFQDFAEVLGALEATKLEFYRRHVSLYEDEKRALNGDVE